MITDKCRDHAEEVKKDLKKFFKANPTTLAILTNGRPDGERYIRNKLKVAQELGVATHFYDVTGRSFDDVVKAIYSLTEDGVMVQMPFFDNAEDNELLSRSIPTMVDVDSLNPSTKHLYGIYPATAQGIFSCFFENYCWNVGVIGRSKLVGDPLANLLMHSDNTVVVCHSQSEEHWSLLQRCDAIVSATGTTIFDLTSKKWLEQSNVGIVVDVGIRVDDDGKLRGDVDKALYSMAGVAFTPVPGGVGLLTTTYLYWNLMKLKEAQNK